MATWVGRGLDKFLCEDMGLDSLVLPEEIKFANQGEDIYRVQFRQNQLGIWSYNIRENLPWKALATVDCGLPQNAAGVLLHDVVVYGKEVFVILGRDDESEGIRSRRVNSIMYCLTPVYNVVENQWTLVNVEGLGVDVENNYVVSWHVIDKYYVFDFAFQQQNVVSVEPANWEDLFIDPIFLRVFNLPTREWLSYETHPINVKYSDAYLGNYLPFSLPSRNTLYLLEPYNAKILRLDLTSMEWKRFQSTGYLPQDLTVLNGVSLNDYIYVLCLDLTAVNLLTMCRIDVNHNWELVKHVGPIPQLRFYNNTPLAVKDRIVIIGGCSSWDNGIQELRQEDGFWFKRNDYDLRCCCGYCMEAGLAGASSGLSNQTSEATIAEFGNLIPVNPESEQFQELISDNTAPWLSIDEKYYIQKEFDCWQGRKDPLASTQFYDIHILDLKPTLQTLAMVKIADTKELDLSNFHKGLHLNLNTMYVFNAKGIKMRNPSDDERELLVIGKVDYRKNQVRALRANGAYNGGVVRRLIQRMVDSRFNVDDV